MTALIALSFCAGALSVPAICLAILMFWASAPGFVADREAGVIEKE